MNIEPINFYGFWLYKYVKNRVKIIGDGMIFSAQSRQWVGEMISVPGQHPGQNQVMLWFFNTKKVFQGFLLFL